MMVAVYCGNPEKGTSGFSLPRRTDTGRDLDIENYGA